MTYSNVISTSIPEENIKEILKSIEVINQNIKGLVTLSKEQKDALPHMGEPTLPFVINAIRAVDDHPELIPPLVDVDEIKKDADLALSIHKILQPLKDIVAKLEDSTLLAESEAYMPSMAIYNSVKNANRTKKLNSQSNFSNYPKVKRFHNTHQLSTMEK
ncbi:MAG: hypothetical protein ACNS62_00220 [Candidatus Cyclobacteriaceae bacterium M3_2C_046]